MLCFALVVSVIAPQSHVDASTSFKDLGTDYRAYTEIMYLVDRDIINGYENGTFMPSKEVTRGEAAAILGRALGLNGTKTNTEFSDVGPNMSASGYINELVKKGIISGYSNGTFQPNTILNRGEMAILLNRAFNFGGTNAATSAKMLMERGIAEGFSDGTFGEHAKIIRADFSVFVARSLNEAFRVKTGEVAFSKTMYVNAGSDTLNMRKAPSTTATVISKLRSGTAVSVAKVDNGWAYIRVNNVIGYVSASYLSVTKPATPVAVSNLSVVIDPGHGGSDPGGVGNGFQEKNVVLNVARHMKSYMDQTPVKGIMTRNTDTFISLGARAQFASRNKADIFVSLHTNALNGAANGQETFYYAKTAATNPNVQQSRALAIYLQARMQEAWTLQNRGVNPFGYGNFAVLRENTVPAALIEMGFIDSPKDIQYIKDDAQRKKMGKYLTLGTLDYFYHYEGRKDLLPAYEKLGAAPSKRLH